MSQAMGRAKAPVAWTLGAWCLEPVGQDAGMDLARARLKARANRAQRQETVVAHAPLPMAGTPEWRGGTLDSVRLGVTAGNWGFFECTDLSREFLEISSDSPQAGFLAAAWHQEPTGPDAEMRAVVVRQGQGIWLSRAATALGQAPDAGARQWAMAFIATQARAMLDSQPREAAWLAELAALRLDQALPEQGRLPGPKAPGRL